MRIGLDTGFFYALQENQPEAVRVWKEGDLATSAVVLFELQRKCLKGDFSGWPDLLSDIQAAVNVAPVTAGTASQAAQLAQGLGLPGLDALILASLLAVECREIYTADTHFRANQKKGVQIILLEI